MMNPKLKLLFLNPPMVTGERFMKEIGRCGRKSVAGELWPQTGLAYLAAVALRRDCEVRLVDAMATGETLEQLKDIVREFAPDIVVTHTTTPTFRNDAYIIGQLKSAQPAVYAFVGTHVSALPEEALAQSRADLIFINEAEGTLNEVILNWPGWWQGIPGLAIRKNGEILITSQCPYISNLDTLPFPARHLLPNERYRMPFFESEPFATVIPTRGCPWKCTFCRAGKVWGNKVRTRSPQNVISEIEQLKNELGIRNVVFMTDSLTLDKKWVRTFLDEVLSRGIKFRWICNSRVDAVDAEMLRMMKTAGCLLISYGVESGSQKILDDCKKMITPEDSRRAIRMTRESGILSMAYFVLGLPGETRETIEETIRFAREINPDYVNFHVATPFPGTELYEIARQNNWLESTDWNDYEEEGSAVLRTQELSAGELIEAQCRAMRSFYLRPGRILKELGRIKNFAQLKARFRAAGSLFKTLSKKATSNK